jgi:hypothetical protein
MPDKQPPDAISLPPVELDAADTGELPKPAPAPALQQPTHVRVGGGQAGMRVQHFEGGVTAHKRVSAMDGRPDAALADHKQVPLAVLAQVSELIDETWTDASALCHTLRELLGPWLESEG